ncbi:MAG: amidase [Acidimicrobiales bacterium]
MTDRVWELDATAQAELVRRGDIPATALVEAALDRAFEMAALYSVTALFPDRALERARSATGPFAGVPILLKDAGQELAGAPLWMGTIGLKRAGHVSTVTTDLVRRLEGIGFVVIGKAAVPELMQGISTEPPIAPPTGNPWAPERTVGGSSGGSAAAVAADIVPLAHGSDSTGSLRYPAGCCGVLTLKPSAGRVPSQPPRGLTTRSDSHTDFVLGRSARDLQGVLGAVARPTPDRVTIGRIARLGAMPFGLEVDPSVTEALDLVAGECRAAGFEVDLIGPEFLETYGRALGAGLPTMVAAHRAAVVGWLESCLGRPATTDDVSPVLLEAAARGRDLDPAAAAGAEAAIAYAATRAARWTDRFDALLLPVLDQPAWPNGSPGSDGRLGGIVNSLANFSGQPSIVIPTVHGGLPVGVQLQGPVGADEALLAVANLVRPTAPRPGRHVATPALSP